MKITSITFIDTASIQVAQRNTQNSQNVSQIMDNLSKAPVGKSLMVAGDDVKKFERYQLQKALQRRGAHVLVSNGIHPTTGKLVLNIKRLSEQEWKEWMKGAEETTKKLSKR